MKTIHRWFRSGSYSLLAHLDLPNPADERGGDGRGRKATADLGVLMIPSFGWEDVSSYRPLRYVAKTIAASGVPVLRFDLPGSGDSTGGAQDVNLLAAWVRATDDAGEELCRATGVGRVTLMGVSLGALLAAHAAARGSITGDLILWGANGSGRGLLREWRAFAGMQRLEFDNGEPPPPQPVPGLEIGGFLITPETQDAIQEFTLPSFPDMHGRRALALSRDEMQPDGKLIRVLKDSGCAVEIAHGAGYNAMMGLPHDAVPPVETAVRMVEFLNPPASEEHRACSKVAMRRTALEERGQQERGVSATIAAVPGVRESIHLVEHGTDTLFGVLAEHDRKPSATDWAVLFLNAGAVRHTGPNRMWVDAARRWAARGVRSLRLDLEGVGESDGIETPGTPGLYQDRLVDQVELAMDSLRSRFGIRNFAAVGLCAGAFWGFHAAARTPDIRAAVLLNPRLFFWDPEVDRQRLLRRTVSAMGQWGDWRRLAQGGVPIESIKQAVRVAFERIQGQAGSRRPQIPAAAMSRAWAAIERNRNRVTFVFTEGEPLLREMEEEGQLPPAACSRVQCLRVVNSGHTFRPLWAQQVIHELIDRELEAALREDSSDPRDFSVENSCGVAQS